MLAAVAASPTSRTGGPRPAPLPRRRRRCRRLRQPRLRRRAGHLAPVLDPAGRHAARRPLRPRVRAAARWPAASAISDALDQPDHERADHRLRRPDSARPGAGGDRVVAARSTGSAAACSGCCSSRDAQATRHRRRGQPHRRARRPAAQDLEAGAGGLSARRACGRERGGVVEARDRRGPPRARATRRCRGRAGSSSSTGPRSAVLGRPGPRAVRRARRARPAAAASASLLTFATARRLDRLDARRDEALAEQRAHRARSAAQPAARAGGPGRR